jgi:hypothetical protein
VHSITSHDWVMVFILPCCWVGHTAQRLCSILYPATVTQQPDKEWQKISLSEPGNDL